MCSASSSCCLSLTGSSMFLFSGPLARFLISWVRLVERAFRTHSERTRVGGLTVARALQKLRLRCVGFTTSPIRLESQRWQPSQSPPAAMSNFIQGTCQDTGATVSALVGLGSAAVRTMALSALQSSAVDDGRTFVLTRPASVDGVDQMDGAKTSAAGAARFSLGPDLSAPPRAAMNAALLLRSVPAVGYTHSQRPGGDAC